MKSEVFFNPSMTGTGLNKLVFKWKIRDSFNYRMVGAETIFFYILSDGKRHEVGSTKDIDSGEFEVTLSSDINTSGDYFGLMAFRVNGKRFSSGVISAFRSAKGSKVVDKARESYRVAWERQGVILPGVLYAKMKNGQTCTTCIDHDSNMHLDSSCPVCFGTGIVDGYYAYDFNVKLMADILGASGDTISKFSDNDIAGVLTFEYTGSLLALMTAGDIWKDSQTGLMYRINKTQATKAISGFPIKVAGVGFELSTNSIEYNMGEVAVERFN